MISVWRSAVFIRMWFHWNLSTQWFASFWKGRPVIYDLIPIFLRALRIGSNFINKFVFALVNYMLVDLSLKPICKWDIDFCYIWFHMRNILTPYLPGSSWRCPDTQIIKQFLWSLGMLNYYQFYLMVDKTPFKMAQYVDICFTYFLEIISVLNAQYCNFISPHTVKKLINVISETLLQTLSHCLLIYNIWINICPEYLPLKWHFI